MKKCLSAIFLIYPNPIKKAWLRAIFVLSLLSISGGVLANDLLISLSTSSQKTSYQASDALLIKFELSNNTNQDIKILKWQTPLEGGFNANMFDVYNGLARVNYIGRLVKRGAPKDQDYIILTAGKTISELINLEQGYDISAMGDYSISYKNNRLKYQALPVSKTKQAHTKQAQSNVILGQSSPVLIEIAENRPSLKKKQKPPVNIKAKLLGKQIPTYQNCSNDETTALDSALDEAERIALIAKDSLNIVPVAKRANATRYTTWFGVYEEERYDTVKTNFNNISNALGTQTIGLDCACADIPASSRDYVYAYVYSDDPYNINLCGAFWGAPTAGSDSQSGTLIHELSHFSVLAGTDDYVYGTAGAKEIANNEPSLAIYNADNYEYFAENSPPLFMPNASSIPAPTGVSASDGSYSSYVEVSWNIVSSTATYTVYRSTSADGTYSQIADNISSLSHNDTPAIAGATYYYKIKACGSSTETCSDYSSYNSGYIPSLMSIAQAIDNTKLSFTNLSEANWYGQTQTFYYDSDAAQSGDISDNQQSCMQTIVTGSSDLSFYWKVSSAYSSEYTDDYLRFYIDNIEQSGKISGDIDWQQKFYQLSPGNKALKWCYTKNESGDDGSDTGWVDKVFHATNDSSILAPSNISASNGSYTSYVQVSWDSVSSTATYAIYRSTSANGTYSQIADSPSSPYDDTSAAIGITYYYKIKACTASVGSATCGGYSDYASGYISSVPIADAIDNTNLSFTSSGDANWFGQTPTFYYDSDAAQSGNIDDKQQSCMQTTVAGSSDLSFYWKVSSENLAGYLRFYIDDIEQSGKISGYIDWQQKSYVLSAGEKVLKWCYNKHESYFNGDMGWVDKIVHATNDSSIQAPTNVNASNGSYTSYVQVSWDSISSVASYTVYRSTSENGTYLQIADNLSSPYNDTSAVAGTTYYYKIKACTGSVGSIACSNYSDYDSGYLPSVLIADAVDNTNLSFTSSGDANWYGQTQTFYYDSDAAQSGDIDHDQQSCMQTTVTGSSDLSFYWKISSVDYNDDYLRFYIDDIEQSGKIRGNTDWQQKFYQLSAGDKALKWCYTKDLFVEGGSDTGWVDKIVHTTNDTSISAPTGVSASNGSYTSYVQVSWDSVSSTATYAIYRSTSENGTYLQIADNQSSPYNDTLAAAGVNYYKIRACTGVGSIACGGYSDYALGYISSVPIADAIDNTNLSFTGSGDANWFGQTQTFYYDSDAAQSGDIGGSQQSCMQTTVTGSSDLSFYWKVSSEYSYDYLRFYIDNSEQSGKISDYTDWQQKSYVLSVGDKVLKWCYTKDSYGDIGSDTGWVDKIVHATNDSSISAPSNVSASNGSYTSYVQVSWDSVSSTATYVIYRSTSENGTYLQIADSPSSPYNDTLAGAGTTYYYKIKACTGSVGIVACSNYSDYDSGYLPSLPIADAIDNANLSFTSLGDANWFGQTQTFYYDSDAAQSGNIGDSQQSCMQTTVAGSSDLSFYWKVSSESGYDYLRFYIDDSEQSGKISGYLDWRQKSYVLSAGDKVLKWCYTKDSSADSGSDAAWIDKIVYATNDSSISAPSNVSASNGSYTDYVQVSWDSVSSTATYAIYRSTSADGAYSQIAASQSLSYNDTLPIIGNTYYYKIKACTGSVGSVACSNYSDYALGYISSVPIADAVDNTNLSFTSSGDANWFGQTQTFYYDSDAAQSGDIGDYQQSCMQTTVAGSNDLSFHWKVSSESDDYLRFYIDDSEQSGKISGNIDWQQKFYVLSAGDKVLKWCYTKDYSADSGSDAAWVDKIVNTTNTYIPAPANVSASNGSYTAYVRVSWDSVSSTATYAIYRSTSADGIYSQIATIPSSPYDDTLAKAGTTYYYKIKACTGLFGNLTCGSNDGYDSGYLPSVPIADAIDNTNLSFTGSGDANWFGQTPTFYYDSDAAQSGDIGYEQQSCMQTTVAGSSDLSFYWKASSHNYDYLRFYIDDSEQSGKISGDTDWQQKFYVLSAGNKTLKWCYIKNSRYGSGSDAAWVDKIVHATNDSSISAPSNVSASNGSYTSHVQVSWDSVSSTATYAIYRSTSENGTYLQIADSPSLSYNDTLAVAGVNYYKIKACTASVGSVTCSNYSDYASGYISLVTIADAVDNTNLSFTSSGDANWFGQTQTFYYDSDAAQSGDIGNEQQSCMQTTVTGSSDLSFYWKISSAYFSEYVDGYLEFYIDNIKQSGKIGGDTDWQQKFYQLSAGDKALKWCYTKDLFVGGGSDTAWVDKIVHATNDSSISAPSNVSASNGSYTSYVQVSWDSVSSTATYAIYRSTSENGTYLQIADSPSSSYNDTLAAAGTTYYYKIKACTGSVGSIACGNYSDYALGYLLSVPIADAVDNTNLSFTISGNANWFGQTQTFYYDSDAAQSGDIDHDQQSCMQTTVTGSSDLSFHWKVSSAYLSEYADDYLEFYIDNIKQSGEISGDTDWQQKSYVLSAGDKVLKWCYTKDSYGDSGSDAGWVDKIVHATNDSSILAPSNVSASNGSYTSYVQVSWDSISSVASYTVYRSTSENGTYLQIADSPSSPYNDTLAAAETTYYYKIKACTGSVGSIACGNYSDYASGYLLSVPIADAVDNTNLSFTSSGDANWFGQTQTFYYDSDAAQSGGIDDNQQSCMQTTVAGSSDLSFYWKVSSEYFSYYLEFYIDNIKQSGKISRDTDWQQKFYQLSAGEKVLKWCYIKDFFVEVEGGSDAAWVDKIVHATNDSSISAPSNVSASNGSYTSYVQVSWDSVSSATTYAIYRSTSENGTYLQIANSQSLSYNDTLSIIGNTYYYKIRACTGSVGSVACSNYSDYALGYLPSVPIADAIDNINLSFTSSGDANWFGQTQTFYYDSDAAQSGNISYDQQSCMQTTVAGSSDLSFYWKISSESDDYLRFYIDDSEQSGAISGDTDWQQKSYVLSAGDKALKWCYSKDLFANSGSGAGWVDKIVNTANSAYTAPIIELLPATITATVGEAIGDITVNNTGGTATSYAISPAIGNGLSFSTATGIISGTPTTTTDSNSIEYTITATNITANSTDTISIKINPKAPSIAILPATFTAVVKTAISGIIITNSAGQELTTCTSNPTLPAGISIAVSTDKATCEFSGTPSTTQDAQTYTITATNITGADSATLSIEVKTFSLDVDGNGSLTASNDGLIIFKYLLNSNANNLHTTISSNAMEGRKTTPELKAYLDDAGTILDADGNQTINASNDGLIIFKYLLNSNANNLHTTISSNAMEGRKTTPQLKAYLDKFR